MTNNKNPSQKQPGEKEPGAFHYNPGNVSGTTIGTTKISLRNPTPMGWTTAMSTKTKTKKPSPTDDEG